jgi:hypothetical protein
LSRRSRKVKVLASLVVPGQIGKLLVGKRCHHDSLAARGGKVAGEAAAHPDVMDRGWPALMRTVS